MSTKNTYKTNFSGDKQFARAKLYGRMEIPRVLRASPSAKYRALGEEIFPECCTTGQISHLIMCGDVWVWGI
jgi:hypothetical protein